MALISQTTTYDTFLANTRGGALYTIRIPLTSPMKPIVKQVRTRPGRASRHWSPRGAASTALSCSASTRTPSTGYLYAVGHANGTATVIKSLGKVPATFADTVYFRYYGDTPEAAKLYGE